VRILLVNPPHPSIGSRIPHEHLPPLGLLALGGPLLDAGQEVRLLDAEFGPMTVGDPDQAQALYATPHRWTPFASQEANRRVIQTDLSRWDYKHQVLESKRVPNWRVLFWVKLIEAVSQLRPRSLFRLFTHPDRGFRAAMRWYYSIGRRVWPYELWHWCFRDRRTLHGPTLAEFLNAGWKVKQARLSAFAREPKRRSSFSLKASVSCRAVGP
jgi:anaerobic magnesium-protoporphyrin IX monomethyl ester cyclase